MKKAHFRTEETQKLVQIVGDFVHRTGSFTENKKIFSKKTWDDIYGKFNAIHSGHSRRAVQSRWDRLKASYAAWAMLQVPASGSDAQGPFPAEVEARRREERDKLKRKAMLAEGSGCLDILQSVLEGRRPTGEHSVDNEAVVVEDVREEPPESEDERNDLESLPALRSVSSEPRGSPKKKNKKRKTDMSRLVDTLTDMKEMIEKKFDTLIEKLFPSIASDPVVDENEAGDDSLDEEIHD
eukprot:TRINITY_DN24707_c0_g1_i1.p1 TRINITY_DN24707_c0_g1~~TRINITY_DN24707_c0_g1_i1.p1  ORF type:complete len:239 (-),score=87.17 TRINITY_DN24707_c0_g1_i1:49-765(-)